MAKKLLKLTHFSYTEKAKNNHPSNWKTAKTPGTTDFTTQLAKLDKNGRIQKLFKKT